jgi:hypothetical protein
MSNLGRRVPTDDNHIRKFPLTLETVPSVPTPVVIGINWYSSFDNYVYDKSTRKYWIARDGNLGTIRGGHCVCLKPSSVPDATGWYDWFDQGNEGACVGFGSARAMSLVYRKKFDPEWLYVEAQNADEWDDTPPEEGTSVRAAFDILRTKGGVTTARGNRGPVDGKYGVLENRWARTVDEVIACLASPNYYKIGGIPFLNSWGRGYPHLTYIPLEVLQRVLNEDGEAAVWTPKTAAKPPVSSIEHFGEE